MLYQPSDCGDSDGVSVARNIGRIAEWLSRTLTNLNSNELGGRRSSDAKLDDDSRRRLYSDERTAIETRNELDKRTIHRAVLETPPNDPVIPLA